MISNTCYELINTSCGLLSYWKRYLGTTDSPVLEYVCPRFEYAENLKNYYRYVAWAEDYNQTEENYWVYAVLQDHEVVDYFKDRESAEAEALNQYDLGYTSSLYVVQITTRYDDWN